MAGETEKLLGEIAQEGGEIAKTVLRGFVVPGARTKPASERIMDAFVATALIDVCCNTVDKARSRPVKGVEMNVEAARDPSARQALTQAAVLGTLSTIASREFAQSVIQSMDAVVVADKGHAGFADKISNFTPLIATYALKAMELMAAGAEGRANQSFRNPDRVIAAANAHIASLHN